MGATRRSYPSRGGYFALVEVVPVGGVLFGGSDVGAIWIPSLSFLRAKTTATATITSSNSVSATVAIQVNCFWRERFRWWTCSGWVSGGVAWFACFVSVILAVFRAASPGCISAGDSTVGSDCTFLVKSIFMTFCTGGGSGEGHLPNSASKTFQVKCTMCPVRTLIMVDSVPHVIQGPRTFSVFLNRHHNVV